MFALMEHKDGKNVVSKVHSYLAGERKHGCVNAEVWEFNRWRDGEMKSDYLSKEEMWRRKTKAGMEPKAIYFSELDQ